MIYLGGFCCATKIIIKTLEHLSKSNDKLDIAGEREDNNSPINTLSMNNTLKIDYDDYKDWLLEDYTNKFNIELALDNKIADLQKSIELATQDSMGLKP